MLWEHAVSIQLTHADESRPQAKSWCANFNGRCHVLLVKVGVEDVLVACGSVSDLSFLQLSQIFAQFAELFIMRLGSTLQVVHLVLVHCNAPGKAALLLMQAHPCRVLQQASANEAWAMLPLAVT